MGISELLLAGLVFLSPNVVDKASASVDTEISSYAETQITCLAMNMYHEARGQGTAGQLAVTAVVLNRVNDKRFPNSICEVVYQGPIRESWKTKTDNTIPDEDRKYYPIRNRCQFSWYCDGKSDTPYDKKNYEQISFLAELIMTNEIRFLDITDGALFYHADYITPGWAKTKQRTIEIEDHIFYRWDTK